MRGFLNFLATPLLFFAAVLNALASHMGYWGMRLMGLDDEEIQAIDEGLE